MWRPSSKKVMTMADSKNKPGPAEVLRRMMKSLEEDDLNEDLPIEEVRADLREMGVDPDELGKRGAAFAKALLEKRREALHEDAVASVAPLEARLAKARARPRGAREEMLARIERARRDPRATAPIAVAFRGRAPEEPSDEELATLCEKLEALGVIEPGDDSSDA